MYLFNPIHLFNMLIFHLMVVYRRLSQIFFLDSWDKRLHAWMWRTYIYIHAVANVSMWTDREMPDGDNTRWCCVPRYALKYVHIYIHIHAYGNIHYIHHIPIFICIYLCVGELKPNSQTKKTCCFASQRRSAGGPDRLCHGWWMRSCKAELRLVGIHGEKSLNRWRWTYCSYGHLPVITGYKWDYTWYKWGFLSTYNWYFGP